MFAFFSCSSHIFLLSFSSRSLSLSRTHTYIHTLFLANTKSTLIIMLISEFVVSFFFSLSRALVLFVVVVVVYGGDGARFLYAFA